MKKNITLEERLDYLLGKTEGRFLGKTLEPSPRLSNRPPRLSKMRHEQRAAGHKKDT